MILELDNNLKNTIGIAFHTLMEFSMELSEIDNNKAKRLLSNYPLSIEGEKLILDSLKNIKNNEECMSILNFQSSFISIEREWIDPFGLLIRPDRVDFNFGKKVIHVIDFKWRIFNYKDEVYISQLVKYELAMKFHYPDMQVKCFLISGDAQISYLNHDHLVHLR